MHFAQAYASTGMALQAAELSLTTVDGLTTLDPESLLPGGLPPGTDLIVQSSAPPTKAALTAIQQAPAAIELAAGLRERPSASPTASGPAVFAKEGSAIAASQAKMGEKSSIF